MTLLPHFINSHSEITYLPALSYNVLTFFVSKCFSYILNNYLQQDLVKTGLDNEQAVSNKRILITIIALYTSILT